VSSFQNCLWCRNSAKASPPIKDRNSKILNAAARAAAQTAGTLSIFFLSLCTAAITELWPEKARLTLRNDPLRHSNSN